MGKKILFSLICFGLINTIIAFGQEKQIVGGVVKDALTSQPLIGATVQYGQAKGTSTDINGKFIIKLPQGEYTMDISYVGYKKITRQVIVGNKNVNLHIELDQEKKEIEGISKVADIARSRETPVAFSNIPSAKLEEELSAQDLPMALNKTPGVYATQQGGGDGDARVNIRGFSQRNVAVMIDGIPVNDMENGWVYWSNWFGLDAVTRNMQIQRGLGASKLALPSVGGTINIITEGIESDFGGSVKQEMGNDGYLRTSFGLTSGRLKNGWGLTAAGSYKRRDGWVDQTWSEANFYYMKIQKDFGKHIISATAMGAPQKHAQRKYAEEIDKYDVEYARDLGINTAYYEEYDDNNEPTGNTIEKEKVGFGRRWNQYWGYLERWERGANGDTINANKQIVNEKVNYYHKPAFSLRDYWSATERLYISNIAYLSIGNGGGIGMKSQSNVTTTDYGQIDFQSLYDNNKRNNIRQDLSTNSGGADAILGYNPELAKQYPLGTRSDPLDYLKSSINQHFWYGFISSVSYELTPELDLSGGIDLRSYKGTHYKEVYDLLGGDYTTNEANQIQTTKIKTKNDKIDYYNDGVVRWGGLFFQGEYKTNKISTFLNITGAYTGYKRVDFFRKKDLVFNDTTIREAVGVHYDNIPAPNFPDGNVAMNSTPDTFYYQGDAYTINSPEARHATRDYKWIPGYTFKTGINYNINDNMNVFMNLGYLNNAPRFNSVYDYDNSLMQNIENEKVKAIEGGYSFKSPRFAANINGYYTIWENKPLSESYEGVDTVNGSAVIVDYYININGMNALHKGVEFDCIYKILRNLELEGLVSIGDWRWTSKDSSRVYDDQQNYVETLYLNAKGIHVGDAAQTQYAASLRYEPIKNLYIKGRYTIFDRYFADFNPIDYNLLDPRNTSSFDNNGNPKQPWKIPMYGLLDLYAGYTFQLDNYGLVLRATVINVLDKIYISDANNNDTYRDYRNRNAFDASSATVFLGMGRQYNLTLQLKF